MSRQTGQRSSWNCDWFPLPGQAVFDREKQQLAAVSRFPGQLDVFVIGFDNRVWTTFWNENTGWNPDFFPLPGQAVFDREKQQLAAVSRFPGQLDVFVIGFDNRVWTTFWNENTGWNPDFFPLPGQAVFDREKQQLAAVSRFPGQLDVFVIGFDNRVWTTFWNENTGWNPDFFPLPGQAVFDREKQQLAAVSRFPGQLDVFVIGFDNRVWTTFWNENTGWNPDFFPLPGQAVFDHEKQQLAVVSRAPGNLDLFVIGFDNHVWTTFWNDAHGWNGDWFPLPGQAVFDREKQQIAVVSRAPGNLDLFVIGFDNHVWTTFWGQRAANPTITLRAVADQGRFIEVAGSGFTCNKTVRLGYDITSGGGPTTHQTGEETLTSDGAGSFIHRIRVNLGGDISGAQVQATDVASDMTATASI